MKWDKFDAQIKCVMCDRTEKTEDERDSPQSLADEHHWFKITIKRGRHTIAGFICNNCIAKFPDIMLEFRDLEVEDD